MKNVEDRDLVLLGKCLKVNEVTLTFSRWFLGLDTFASEWFKPKPRWVTFVGIPYHLLTFETMELLCKSFCKAKDFAKFGAIVGELSGG